MPRTQSEMAERVLRKLSVLDAVESISAEDDALIDEVYTDKLEELRDEGLVYWAANSIPNAVFPALIKIIAYEAAPEFGLGQDDRMLLLGMAQLRRHITKRPSGEPVRAQYF